MDGHRRAEVVLGVALAAAGTSVLTTWTRSGRRERGALDTLESLDRLGLVASPWDGVLVVVSAALPLLLAAAVAGVAWGRRALAAAGALSSALVLGVWAGVVLRSPIDAPPGPHLALVAALALTVTTAVTSRAQRRR